MKSIVEEASSLMKAIEKGWTSAGNPKEFTIKIYEEPQKNFIGITIRPAKIGIFFTEAALAKTEQQARKKKTYQEERTSSRQVSREQTARTPKQKELPKREQRVGQEQPRNVEFAEKDFKQGPIWTDEMIGRVQEWLSEISPWMDIQAPFTLEAHHFHLKIHFEGALYEDKTRQKYLFAHLSNLLLTMLKRHYKRPLKGYKIVLLGE